MWSPLGQHLVKKNEHIEKTEECDFVGMEDITTETQKRRQTLAGVL